ncbi:hypothetical protein Cni_G10836 [Canna indica]|uniref:Uncharacterized protein n=1 Tax=Canna indica TaxID=4628 RepID=A0AAQ3K8S6_9LILI|nr:hypothetical protein Cni_G10836 [Canna indica]
MSKSLKGIDYKAKVHLNTLATAMNVSHIVLIKLHIKIRFKESLSTLTSDLDVEPLLKEKATHHFLKVMKGSIASFPALLLAKGFCNLTLLLMGNCMQRGAARQVEEEMEPEKVEESFPEKAGGCKVKILLTRKELEWLVHHLKEKGEQRLEDVLVEMGREMDKGRGKGIGWKPTLESIVEIPEVQSFDAVM